MSARPGPASRASAADERTFRRRVRARHPRLRRAILADARIHSAHRGRRLEDASGARVALEALRLMWESDSFLGQCLYRLKARLQALGVPILPRVCHRLAIACSQICIGDPVVLQPGVHLVHGQIVIDGIVVVGSSTTIFPFVTIGLVAGELTGPKIGRGVTIGSGAKVLGPVSVGPGAKVGANSVVLDDVPEGATVVGAPARVTVERGG